MHGNCIECNDTTSGHLLSRRTSPPENVTLPSVPLHVPTPFHFPQPGGPTHIRTPLHTSYPPSTILRQRPNHPSRKVSLLLLVPTTQSNPSMSSRLDRRSSLLSRDEPSPRIVWCAPYGSTFVSLVAFHVIPPSASGIHNDVLATLYTAWDIARTHVDRSGDGIIGHNGGYTLVGDAGIRLSAWNVNNHQLTWGVLGAALMAVMDYMRVKDWYGAVTFDIYDGVNKVATAFLS